MRTCPECGAQFEDGKSFCPGCGKYLPLSAESAPEKSVPALSEDPVAKLLNIDVPNLTENTPDFGKEAFAKIFKESLAESAPERVAPAPEKPEGNPPKREVSWETSYKETHEEELENLDDFGKPSSAPEKAEQKSPEPVDLSSIVKAEATVIEKNEVPSVGIFVLTVFLLSIPAVGLIYLLALAIGKTKYPAKANLARGILLFVLIVCFVLSVLFLAAVFGFGFDPAPYADAFWEAVLAVGEIFSTKF